MDVIEYWHWDRGRRRRRRGLVGNALPYDHQ